MYTDRFCPAAAAAHRRTLSAAWSASSWGPSCSNSAPSHDMSSRRSDARADTPSAAPTIDNRAHPSTLQSTFNMGSGSCKDSHLLSRKWQRRLSLHLGAGIWRPATYDDNTLTGSSRCFHSGMTSWALLASHLRAVSAGSGAAKPRPSLVSCPQCCRLSSRSDDSPGSPACSTQATAVRQPGMNL